VPQQEPDVKTGAHPVKAEAYPTVHLTGYYESVESDEEEEDEEEELNE